VASWPRVTARVGGWVGLSDAPASSGRSAGELRTFHPFNALPHAISHIAWAIRSQDRCLSCLTVFVVRPFSPPSSLFSERNVEARGEASWSETFCYHAEWVAGWQAIDRLAHVSRCSAAALSSTRPAAAAAAVVVQSNSCSWSAAAALAAARRRWEQKHWLLLLLLLAIGALSSSASSVLAYTYSVASSLLASTLKQFCMYWMLANRLVVVFLSFGRTAANVRRSTVNLLHAVDCN